MFPAQAKATLAMGERLVDCVEFHDLIAARGRRVARGQDDRGGGVGRRGARRCRQTVIKCDYSFPAGPTDGSGTVRGWK